MADSSIDAQARYSKKLILGKRGSNDQAGEIQIYSLGDFMTPFRKIWSWSPTDESSGEENMKRDLSCLSDSSSATVAKSFDKGRKIVALIGGGAVVIEKGSEAGEIYRPNRLLFGTCNIASDTHDVSVIPGGTAGGVSYPDRVITADNGNATRGLHVFTVPDKMQEDKVVTQFDQAISGFPASHSLLWDEHGISDGSGGDRHPVLWAVGTDDTPYASQGKTISSQLKAYTYDGRSGSIFDPFLVESKSIKFNKTNTPLSEYPDYLDEPHDMAISPMGESGDRALYISTDATVFRYSPATDEVPHKVAKENDPFLRQFSTYSRGGGDSLRSGENEMGSMKSLDMNSQGQLLVSQPDWKKDFSHHVDSFSESYPDKRHSYGIDGSVYRAKWFVDK